MANQTVAISAFEKALVFGDISGLDERGRLDYLKALCEGAGLSISSRPFGYMNVLGTTTVYLTAQGAAQLRLIHNLSISEIVDEGVVEGFYRVKVYGGNGRGRTDVEYGSVEVKGRKAGSTATNQDIEDIRKKAVTQAKTRLTKSLTGMAGIISEEEAEAIGGVIVQEDAPRQLNPRGADTVTGEVPPKEPKDSDPAPASWRKKLDALRLELFAIADTTVTVPEPLTVAQARKLKAEWETQIAAVRQILADEAAALETGDLAEVGV